MLVRRHRAASAAVLLALLSLGVGVTGLWRDLRHSRSEATLGWRAHTEAALAARMLEDLARSAAADSPAALGSALDHTAARLARETALGPETEGRLRIALGALYLEAGRTADAVFHLERAREIAASTRGFGRVDRERIDALLRDAQP